MTRLLLVVATAAAVAWAALPASGAESAAPGDEAVPDCVRAAVDAIQKRYEAVEDLQARFEQTTRSVALGAAGPVSKSTGTVTFAKPGKMRWHYREPEESLMVSDGSTLWLYDPEAREAQKLTVGADYISGAAIQFLLGEGEILRDFRVEADACSDSEARLTLVPREPASYEKLRVVADAGSGDLRETEITDLLGNVTRVVFRDLRADTDPSDDLFGFDPPDGVEVIEIVPNP